MSSKTTVNIVVALNCEAKPLIDFYRLSKVQSRPFDLYVGSLAGNNKDKSNNGELECTVNLVVSGLGSQNMSIACGWLAGRTDQQQTIWLNIGTAGHKELATSEIVRVHRVVDVADGRSHYPALTAKWRGLSSALLTYDSACSNYPEDALVDMEGSAFFHAAGMFASSELVQAIKIVSDNHVESVERLNASLISQLITPHTNVINQYVVSLLALLPSSQDLTDYLSMVRHLHCTVSQRQQYKELLSKLASLDQLNSQTAEEINNADSITALIKGLRNQLANLQPSLAEMRN